MNYWITTQWPLEVGETRRFAVWLPDDGRQNAVTSAMFMSHAPAERGSTGKADFQLPGRKAQQAL